MSHTPRRLLAAVVAVLLASAVAVIGAAAPAQASVTGQPSVEAQLLALTNSARAGAGLPALHTSSTLQAIARSWSAHQATTNVLAHNPSLFSSVRGWSSMGENVAKAYSASQAQSLFMGSAPHRANILNSAYTLVGIGVSRDSSGALWFTIDFERPSGAAPAPKPAPRPVPKPVTHQPSSTSARQAASSRATRSTIRTVAPRPVAKKVAAVPVPATVPAARQLDRVTRANPDGAVLTADPPVALADLSASIASPSPLLTTTTLVGFIASMTLAAAGLLVLGATRTRRRG